MPVYLPPYTVPSVLKSSAFLCFFILILSSCLLAQDGEREIVGEVSTSNYRAPFGDDLEIFNLGDEVNSEFSEYNPVISPNAELMMFTTRSDSTTGEQIYQEDRRYFEDIHIARAVDGRYVADDKVDHPLGAFTGIVNSKKHEAPVYIDDDASTILLFKENDLWYSELTDGVYTEPERYPENINFKYYHRHASLTKDGNTMVFTSEVLDKKLNRFHLDIFKTTKGEDGAWSKPERLPTFINTPYNEDSPEISPDGKLLFFSSDRTDGMGGYDVYYVELFKNDSIVHRLAEPINSAADDIYFKMIQDSSIAFLSSNRLGGFGEMDIYKLLFHRFDTEDCEPGATRNSKLQITGRDTVVQNGRLIFSGAGSRISGKSPRTTHWYLSDSLVSVTDRLDMVMQEEGAFEVRLYASIIDKQQMKFFSACTSKTVTVLPPEDFANDLKAKRAVDQLDPSCTEQQMLLGLPQPTGAFELQNDVVTTYVDNPVVIKAMKNDQVDEEVLLSISSVGRPMHGTAVIQDSEKGTLLYYPMEGFVGLDAFRYQVRTPYGKKATAWVGVRVLDNSLFSKHKKIKDDEFETKMETALSMNVFKNDIIPEGMRIRISRTTLPENGNLSGVDLNSGVIKYMPAEGFVGSDMFTYAVDYPEEGEQKAFVRVHVLGLEGRMPIRTSPDFGSTTEGELLSLNVFLNDHFSEADEPRIASISKTLNGASQIYDAEEGTVVYAPYKSFNGYEYFTYTAELKDGSKHVEAISIYVEPEAEILAAVDQPLESSGDEVYDITEVDEDRVDTDLKPDLALRPIYFGFDRVDVRQEARDVMRKNIEVLKQYPKTVIRVMSHCDSRGPKAYNMILSARRAKSTVDYLVANGIAKERIVASVGVGEEDLVNDCGDGVPCSPEQHEKNRRSEFEIVGSLKD